MLEWYWILFFSVIGFYICFMFAIIVVAFVHAIKMYKELCKELDEHENN